MNKGRSGLTLAERSAASGLLVPMDDVAAGAGAEQRRRPVVSRHCWVSGLNDYPGRWAGVLVEWRRDLSAGRGEGPDGWLGHVVYVVDDGAETVTVSAWVPARFLQPAADAGHT